MATRKKASGPTRRTGGRVLDVESVERVVTEEGAQITDVKASEDGRTTKTLEHFAPPGDDSLPLPGDHLAAVEAPGSGNENAVGYQDLKNAPKAQPGEKRTYARNPAGVVVAEIWSKGSGDIEITSLAPGGKVTINGVTIDQSGNISTPGDVTAKASTPATAVTLSGHLHPTGVGPTGSPTPGT